MNTFKDKKVEFSMMQVGTQLLLSFRYILARNLFYFHTNQFLISIFFSLETRSSGLFHRIGPSNVAAHFNGRHGLDSL